MQPANATQPAPSKLAAWPACPVNVSNDSPASATKGGNLGTSTRVTTNYLAVTRVPPTLYVYSIKYMAPKKSTEREKEQSHAGKGAVAIPGDLDASTDDQHREFKRRSERIRIWEVLKQTTEPFCSRADWATDLNTMWSLTPYNSVEPSVNQVFPVSGVIYKKSSGRFTTLDRVEFTFNRILDFNSGSEAASILDIGPKTSKGGSMRVTALNGLISKHATDLQPVILSSQVK